MDAITINEVEFVRGCYNGWVYYASRCGQIATLSRKAGSRFGKPYIISQITHAQTKNNKTYKYGHRYVPTNHGGKISSVLVSKLIAHVFIPNPDNYPCVLHIDETLDENGHLDNSVTNLKWGTRKHNRMDAVQKGRTKKGEDHHLFGCCGEKHPSSKLTDAQRAEIINLYATGNYTQASLGEMFGVARITVHKITKKTNMSEENNNPGTILRK